MKQMYSFLQMQLCIVLLLVFSLSTIMAKAAEAECSTPTQISIVGLTTTSGILTWSLETDNLAPQYDYVVSSQRIASNQWESIDAQSSGVVAYGKGETIYDNILLLEGLNAGTTYYVLIRQNCASDYNGYSAWLSFSFNTMCEPVELPLDTLNFNNGFLSACWLTSGDCTIQSTNRYGNSGSALKLSNTAENSAYLYSPSIAGQSGNSELLFQIYSGSAKQKFVVGLVPFGADITTDIQVVMRDSTVAGEWKEISVVDHANLCSDGYLWVIYAEAGNSTTLYIDNVVIHEKSSCVRPADLQILDIQSSSVTLGWTERGEASQWIISIKEDGGQEQLVTTNQNPFTITSLQAQTFYTVKVRSVCDDGVQSDFCSVDKPFRTLCDFFELPYVEDFGTTNNSDILYCWTIFTYDNGASYTRSEVSLIDDASYAVSGYCLRLRAASNGRVIAALPQVDADLNTLCIDFTTRFENTTYGTLEFGYLTNLTDEDSFVALQTIPNSMSKVTYYVELNEVPLTAKSLAFRFTYTGSSYYDVGIDNINLRTIPTCSRPHAPELGTLTSDGAEFTLSNASGATEWEVIYTEEATIDTIIVDGNTLNLPLESGKHTFTLATRAICAVGDTSEVTTTSFTLDVPCAAFQLPFYEDFNSITLGVPICWDNSDGNMSSSYGWNIYSYTTYDGSNVLRFYGNYSYAGTTIYYQNLKIPVVDLTENAKLSFVYKKSSSDGEFNVLISTDYGLTVDTIAANLSDTEWTEFTYDLSAYTGQQVMIIFNGINESNYYSYIYIDNVIVESLDACQVPTEVVVTSVLSTQAQVKVAGVVGTAELQFSQVGTVEAEDTHKSLTMLVPDGADEVTFLLDNLLPNTTYEVKVRNICSADNISRWSGTTTFTTPCSAYSLPFEENFNDITSGIPSCWDNSEGTTTTNSYRWSSGSSSDKMWDAGYLVFNSYNNSNGNTNFLKTPLIDIQDDARLTFMCRKPSAAGQMDVYISTDGGMTRTPLITDLVSEEWKEFTCDLSAYVDHQVMIIFKATSNFGALDAYMYLDNVIVESYNSCLSPTDLKVSAFDDVSATITWVSRMGKHEIQLYNSLQNIEEDAPLIEVEDFEGKQYTFTNLDDNTNYFVRVRTICDEDTTKWVSTKFKTECSPVVLPFSDGIEENETSFPDCWTIEGDGTLTIATDKHHSGERSLKGQNVTLSSMRFDFEEGKNFSNYMISFFALATTDGQSLTIALSTGESENDLPIECAISTANTWQEFSNTLTALSELDNVADYKYLILNFNSEQAVYIDDLTIEEITTCPRPSTLTVSDIEGTTAKINWRLNGEENKWKLTIFDGANEVIRTEIITQKPYTITGLTELTSYIVGLQSICSEGDTSAISYIPFTTVQTPISLPYNTYFAEENNAGWLFVNDGQTNHWVVGNYDTNTTALYIAKDGDGTSGYDTGKASIVWATKTFKVETAGTYNINFDWMAYGESSYDYLRAFFVPISTELEAGELSGVGYTTTPNGFVALDNGGGLNLQNTRQNQNMGIQLSEGVYKFAFLWRNDGFTGEQPAAVVYNLSIQQLLCPIDNPQVVSVTSDEATISVPNLGSGMTIEYVLSTSSIIPDEATNIQTSTKSQFTITGLNNLTSYILYVRTVCSETEKSVWRVLTFTTACGTASLPFIEDFNSITSGVPVCWDNTQGTTSNVSYRWSSYTSSNSYDGSRYLRFDSYNNSKDNTNFLNTPTINLDKNSLLSFMCKKPSSAGQMDVYISVDGGVNMLDTLFESIVANDWTEFTYDLTPYTGQQVTIVFKGTSNYGAGDAYMYLDNVIVESLDACVIPSAVEIVSFTNNQAVVKVKGAVGTIELDYGEEETIIAQVPEDEEEVTITLTDLLANTQYTVRARNICDADDFSRWTGAIILTTLCDPFAMPFEETFSTTDSDIPDCWDNSDGNMPVSSYSKYGWATYTSSSDAYDGSSMMRFYGDYSYSTDYYQNLKTPLIDLREDANLSFVFKKSSSFYGEFNILITADGGLTLDTLAHDLYAASWTEVSYNLSSYTGKQVMIIFNGINASSSSAYFYLDEVRVESINTCQPPIAIILDDVTTDMALIKVVGATGSAYVEYGDGISKTEFVTGDTTAIMLTELEPNTVYTVRTRSICQEGDTSRWASANTNLIFRTKCLPTELPLEENFNDVEAYSLPDCWNNEEGHLYSTSYGWKGASTLDAFEGKSIYYNGYYTDDYQYLKSPVIFLQSMARLSFIHKENTCGKLDVYLSTDGGQTIADTLAMGLISDEWTEGVFDLDKYINQQVVIIFKGTSITSGSTYVYLDNISITEKSGCYDLASVKATNITATSATLNVTGAINTILAEYKVTGSEDEPLSVTVEVDQEGKATIPLNGLTELTSYDVRVRSICGEADSSAWYNISFKTIQTPVDLPYTADFSSIETAQWQLINGTQVNHWTVGGPIYDTIPAALYISKDADGTAGFNASSQSYVWAVKTFNAAEDGRYIIDYQWMNYGGYSAYIRAFIVPITVALEAGNGMNISTSSSSDPIGWINIDNGALYSQQTLRSVSKEVELTQGIYNLVFYWYNSSYVTYYNPAPVVTNVKISRVMCDWVTPTVKDITDTEATVTIDALDDDATIDYVLGTYSTNPDDETPVRVTGNTFTLTDLEMSTSYYIYVRVVCDEDITSEWRSTYFKTTCAVLSTPYEELFEESVTNDGCWKSYNGFFTDGVQTSSLSSASGWNYSSTVKNGIPGGHMYIENWSTFTKNWLVTPSIEVKGADNVLMFDVALTKYNYSNEQLAPTKGGQPDDKFIVAVSEDNGETWYYENAREWNNTGSAYVYDDIPTTLTSQSMGLSKFEGKTIKIAFYAESKVSNGDNYLHIDNLRIAEFNTINLPKDTVCAGESYTNGIFNIDTENLTPGMTHQFSEVVMSPSGNTLYNLELYVNPSVHIELFDTVCANTPYSGYGFEIANPTSRRYTLSDLKSVTGCDSIVDLYLHVVQTEYEEYRTVCEGDLPLTFGTQNLTAAGDYTEVFQGMYCDSIVTLHLNVIELFNTENVTLCEGESVFFDGKEIKQEGSYQATFVSSVGCDSIVTLNVTVLHPQYYDYTGYLCDNKDYSDEYFNDLTAAGVYTSKLPIPATNGCDSIVRLTLQAVATQRVVLDETICSGEFYIFNGNTLYESVSGVQATFQNEYGCDSTVVLNLTVLPTTEVEIRLTLSPEDFPYIFAQTADSVYIINDYVEGTQWLDFEMRGASENGCDSIVHLELTVAVVDGLGNLAVNKLNITPNFIPVGTTTYLYNDFAATQTVTIEIYSSTGQQVSTMKTQGKQIELTGFNAAGLYMVKLTDEQGKVYVGQVIAK